jgi:hypothetical protein
MNSKLGTITFFGSGENSSFGRSIHELLIKKFSPPVKIGLIETPAGFEANPHLWYKNLENLMIKGLKNYKPEIVRIEALVKDGEYGVNNQKYVEQLRKMDYIHTGAGSPTYALKMFKDSLIWKECLNKLRNGFALSFASAASVAVGKYSLPVYEIFKVGEDLHWNEGLNLLEKYGINLTFIPHWNNQEGGSRIDTSRCFMGKKRFEKLEKIIWKKSVIVGIDEFTALIIIPSKQIIIKQGKGSVLIKFGQMKMELEENLIYPLDILKGKMIKGKRVLKKTIQSLFLSSPKRQKIIDQFPEEIIILLQQRKMAKENNNFSLSDKLRQKIESFGYEVRDTLKGQELFKKT